MNKVKKTTPADKMAKSLMEDLKGMQSYGQKKPVKKADADSFEKLVNADQSLQTLLEKDELEKLLKPEKSAEDESTQAKTKTRNKNLLKDSIMLTDHAQTISGESSKNWDQESEKTMLLSDAENKPIDANDFSLVLSGEGPASSYSINNEATLSGKKATHHAVASSQTTEPPEVKVTYGVAKTQLRNFSNESVSSVQTQLLQAETLKIAQLRIIDLEKEVDRLRHENDGLLSAGDVNNRKNEEYIQRIQSLERSKFDVADQAQQEVRLYKENLLSKDQEVIRLRNKIDEMNQRLNADMKKVRVRERELENRLELSKMEKVALVRTKDESILELKRKIDLMSVELDNYKTKCIELNQKIESNQEQFSRTVRALRLALTNLEANEHTLSITLAPLKKAE